MRVLVITPDYPPAKGGIQKLLFDIAHHLPGCEVEVVTQGRAGGADRRDPVPVRRSGELGRLDPRLGILGVNALALARGLRRRPDVVLCGHVVTAPAAAALARLAGCPFVLVVHAAEVAHRPGAAGWACRRAAAVIAVSAFSAGLAERAGAAKVHVIHPGIAAPATDPELGGRAPEIVAVGRLQERYKGYDVLVRAMALVRAALPEATLQVVGDGPLRPALEAQARAAGLGRAVVFHGRLEDPARDALMDRAACLALPSRLGPGGVGEGFGIVCLEAAAHGLAVVAGRAAGALDAVEDGVSGILVDPTDPVDTADALIRVLRHDGLRRRLAEGGLRRAREQDWARVGARVREVLAATAGVSPAETAGHGKPSGGSPASGPDA
jgi:phosphatidylinositol alpha-1,6-mannosyltransferase